MDLVRLAHARKRGFRVHLYYLWLPSVSVALRRIRQRVAKGGHDVPVADVKRRFRPGLENFFYRYLALADSALLFDGSTRPPKLVAEFSKEGHIVRDVATYERIRQAIQ